MTSTVDFSLLFDDKRLNRLNREQLLTAFKTLRAHVPPPATPAANQKPFDADRYAVRRVALRVAYQGWDFRGVAAQGDTDETIEGELFKALVRVRLIESVKTCNFSRSGRTDKGVSAFEQVFALDLRSQCAPSDDAIGFVRGAVSGAAFNAKPVEMDYAMMLNRVLPLSIRVTAWAPVALGFDARFSTLYRTYRYYFFDHNRLDLRRMREAARHFVGEHDFRNFCKVDFGVQTFMRTIIAFEVRALETTARAAHRGRLCELRVRGFAFLWHQVRNMAAVLFAVGEGLEEPDIVQRMLDISAMPAKPVYEMATDTPLVLHEAVYEGVVWNNHCAPFVAAALAEQAEQLAMKLAIVDGFIESLPANATARLQQNDAEGATRPKHIPLLNRRCEPPLAHKQAKLNAKRHDPRTHTAAADGDEGHTRLGAVQEECAKYQTRVTQFSDGFADSVAASNMAHDHAMNAGKENIKGMNRSAEAKQAEIASLQEKLALEKANLDASTKKLFELKEQVQTKMPQELASTRQALASQQQEIEKEKRLFDEVNKEKEYKTNELSLGRDFYRKYLSLDFQRVEDNRLRFVFTNIDPANHDRQFIFSVFINNSNKYELVECEPRLPSLDALLADLNADNNFSRFVQRMRAQFRAIALH